MPFLESRSVKMNVFPYATDSLPNSRFLSGTGRALVICPDSLSQADIGDYRCVFSKHSHCRTAEGRRRICVRGCVLHVEVVLMEIHSFYEMAIGFRFISRQVFCAKLRVDFPVRMNNRFDQLAGEFNDFSFRMSCVWHERKRPYEDSCV